MIARIWPWSALAKMACALEQARDAAENLRTALRAEREESVALRSRVRAQQANEDKLHEDMAALTIERDAARLEIEWAREKKSRQVAAGNRTRARNRRGLLLPPPINDVAGPMADLRTEQAG